MRVTPKTLAPTARSLANELAHRSIRLRVEDARLRWQAPTGAMDVSLLRQIKRHEAELIALVRGDGES